MFPYVYKLNKLQETSMSTLQKISLAIIAIIALLVVAPWYAGQQVESRLDHIIEGVNKNGLVKLEKVNFVKGYRSSTFKLKFSLDTAKLGPAADELAKIPLKNFELTGNASHGPLLMNSGLMFGLAHIDFSADVDEATKTEMTKLFGTQNPLKLGMDMGWGGSTHLMGSLVEFTDPEGHVHSKPVNLTVDFDNETGTMNTEMNWGGIRIEEPGPKSQVKVEIGKMDFHSKQKRTKHQLWVGKSSFNLEKVAFQQAELNVLLNKLAISSGVNMDKANEFLSGNVVFTADDVTVNAKRYAKSFKYMMSMDHWDAEGLQKLSQVVEDAQKSGASPEELQMAISMQMLGILPNMVKKGLTLKMDTLEALVLDQQVKASFAINVAEGTDVTQGMGALKTVSATFDVSIPKALSDQYPALFLDSFVQQGFAKLEAEVYLTHAEFTKGKLQVNGKDIPLPMLGM